MAKNRIGGRFYRTVPLNDDERVLRHAPCLQYMGWFFPQQMGELYLTTSRLVWTPMLFQLAFSKKLILSKADVHRVEVNRRSIPSLILFGFRTEMRLQSSRGIAVFGVYGRRGNDQMPAEQWKVAIDEWLTASE